MLVSPGRAQRPWLGQVDAGAVEDVPAYDPECALCPGNTRASGVRNPEYQAGFVFSNDFPALRPGPPAEGSVPDGVLRREPVSGTCRVVCFSPRHDLSLASLGSEGIRGVVDLWIEQVSEDLTFQEVPIPPDVAVVVLDTGTCRGLVGSVYNERRETCRRAARALGVEALRDVDAEKLSAEGG